MPFHQTSPTSNSDREVQSMPRVPNAVLALVFPLVSLGSACKRNRGSWARTFSLAANAWQLLSQSLQKQHVLPKLLARTPKPKTRVAGVKTQPYCPLFQCVGNFVAGDRHNTPTRHFRDGGDPLPDSTLLPRRIAGRAALVIISRTELYRFTSQVNNYLQVG